MSIRTTMIAALVAAATALAAPTLAATPTAETETPRLIVLVAVDQGRYDYLPALRSGFTGGLKTLMDEGAVFTNAHLDHYPSVTAVGHSTMLTGAPPSVSGIIGNDWYDRAEKRNVTSVEDPGTARLGSGGGARLLPAPPEGQHRRGRAEDGSPRLPRGQHVVQGPQRHPHGRPDGRRRPVVGRPDREPSSPAPGTRRRCPVGRGLQRGPARGRLGGQGVARR